MHNFSKIIVLFGLFLFSCASSSKSAIVKQENFINSHPNWRGHNFNFKGKKLNTDVFKIKGALKQEQKIQFVQDSIILNMNQENNTSLQTLKFF